MWEKLSNGHKRPSIRYRTTAAERSTSKAFHDIAQGAAMWELWGALAYNDIRQRYRRSFLGPLWFTISMGLTISTIGIVYAELFKQPVWDYLPFLAVGFITWALLSGIVTDACIAFIGAEGVIRQLRVPYSTHVFRLLWRNLIVLGHNLLIYVVVALVFAIPPSLALLLAIPGIILICLNGLWMGLLFGALCARFRDLPPIIANILQIFFYITPIVWKPDQLAAHREVVYLNPAYYFLELLREPLLGAAPSVSTWLVVIAVAVLGWLVTLWFLARFLGRIAFWV